MYRRLATLITVLALAACSGSPSSTAAVPQTVARATPPTIGASPAGIIPRPPLPGHPPKPKKCVTSKAEHRDCVRATSKVRLPVYLVREARPVRGGRRPSYVSPSTNGLTWTATLSGASSPAYTGTYNVSSGSSLCTSGSPRTCEIPFDVPGTASGITYTFELILYDQAPNGSGVIPNSAHALGVATLTATVYTNQANDYAFSVEGIWVSTVTTDTSGNALSYDSLPADGASHTLTIDVQALDADGNIISGANPYYAPVPISLAESGGSGQTHLVIDGTSSGTSGNLTQPSDTLALSYSGGGSAGYSTVTNAGGSTVTMSPLYLAPTTATSIKLTDSKTSAVTEANAPAGIAYAATGGTCAATLNPSVSGTGSAATLTVGSHAPAGTQQTCQIKVTDVLGTSNTMALSFVVPGPITQPGTPSFPTGGSGTCSSSIAFTATGQTAVMTITDPLYTGSLSAVSSSGSVASVSVSGSGATESATITAGVAGTSTITFSDTAGNSFACPIGVTTSGGSVS